MLDGVYDVLPLGDFTEDGVFSVKPVGGDVGDKELTTVSSGACVGHRKDAGLAVFEGGVELVAEAVTGAAHAAAGGVAALDHEVFDDAMELDAVVVPPFGEIKEVCAGHGNLGREQGGFDFTFAGVDDDSDVAHKAWESGGALLSGQARKRRGEGGAGAWDSASEGGRGDFFEVLGIVVDDEVWSESCKQMPLKGVVPSGVVVVTPLRSSPLRICYVSPMIG